MKAMRAIRNLLLVAIVGARRSWRSSRRRAYPTPTGSPTVNGLAGFAKILCSAVFVSGRDAAEAAQEQRLLLHAARRAGRGHLRRSIATQKLVTATFAARRAMARLYGDQGCIIQNPDQAGHPLQARAGADDACPTRLRSRGRWATARDTTPILPAWIRREVDAALDAAFADPAALTPAFLVVHKGRIVAERYAPGITKDTQLESWSMGKSITSTLFALLVKDGTYKLDAARAGAAVAGARRSARRRSATSICCSMSAGLKFVGNQEPGGSPPTTVLGSLLHLHGRDRRVQLLDHAAASSSRRDRRPVPQLRSADDRIPDQARRAGARRGVSDVAAADALRSHRDPTPGARDRSLRQLPAHRVRLRHGAQLGAARPAVSAGRHVEGRAHPARGMERRS